MAKVKVPGVYMIRNNNNGKVYIGSSNDIRKRMKQYTWASKSNSEYSEVKRPILKAIRKEGIENFTFSILECGDKFEDKVFRYGVEAAYIATYRSDDPKYGYNGTSGNDHNTLYYDHHRTQKYVERMNRAKPVFSYDIETGGTLLFIGGAKAAGRHFGFSKDVMSHTVKRGSMLKDKYYIIPALHKEREAIIDSLRTKKLSGSHPNSKAVRAFNAYKDASDKIAKIAKEFGYD